MTIFWEQNRIWHDPVVEIFGNLITPTVRCAGQAYDLANRRWYQLNVDSVVTDDDWMSDVVAKHVREYYETHHAPPPWNAIHTNSSDTVVSFTNEPARRVERPVTEKFYYGDGPEDKLPVVAFDQVRQKVYLSRAADYCTWNDKKCVFKRIEFDVDVESFQREIQTRDKLIGHMHGTGPEELNNEMLRRFKVVPILAVVTDCSGPNQAGNIMGFVMPFLGNSLELLSDSPGPDLIISQHQLGGLVKGVWELSRCGVMHGDVKFWNTVLEQPPYQIPSPDNPRLLFIDLGDIAPEYDDDVRALGELFEWCLEHSPHLTADLAVKTKVETVAALLKAGDIDAAVAAMDTE